MRPTLVAGRTPDRRASGKAHRARIALCHSRYRFENGCDLDVRRQDYTAAETRVKDVSLANMSQAVRTAVTELLGIAQLLAKSDLRRCPAAAGILRRETINER